MNCMWNSTDWAAAADVALHHSAYAIALFCLTTALLLCFVIALFVLTISMELMSQSMYAPAGRREKMEAQACI